LRVAAEQALAGSQQVDKKGEQLVVSLVSL